MAPIFTNLTPEHLNRHGTMEAYGAAKRALFVRGGRRGPDRRDQRRRRVRPGVSPGRSRTGRPRASATDGAADAEYRIVESQLERRASRRSRSRSPSGQLTPQYPPAGRSTTRGTWSRCWRWPTGWASPRRAHVAALASRAAGAGAIRGRSSVDRPFDVVVDFAYSADSVAAVLATARGIVDAAGRAADRGASGSSAGAGPMTGREVAASRASAATT